MTREKQLELLLREAMSFLKTRGTYYYNSQRRGVAADLITRVENVLDRRSDEINRAIDEIAT